MSYRFDHNRNGGGIMLYIRQDIPSRLIHRKVRNKVEYIFVEINLRKKNVFFVVLLTLGRILYQIMLKY